MYSIFILIDRNYSIVKLRLAQYKSIKKPSLEKKALYAVVYYGQNKKKLTDTEFLLGNSLGFRTLLSYLVFQDLDI
jgi:hypothetical protein